MYAYVVLMESRLFRSNLKNLGDKNLYVFMLEHRSIIMPCIHRKIFPEYVYTFSR